MDAKELSDLLHGIAPAIGEHVQISIEDLRREMLAEVDAAMEPLRRRVAALEAEAGLVVHGRTATAPVICDIRAAFHSLNNALFDGTLADPSLCIHFERSRFGMFRPPSTISLHADLARLPLTDDALVTLAHEAVHLWRHAFVLSGAIEPGGAIHGGAWAGKMRGLGIDPETHVVTPGGPFAEWLADWRGSAS